MGDAGAWIAAAASWLGGGVLVYLMQRHDRAGSHRSADHVMLRNVTQMIAMIRSEQEAHGAKLDDLAERLARMEGQQSVRREHHPFRRS